MKKTSPNKKKSNKKEAKNHGKKCGKRKEKTVEIYRSKKKSHNKIRCGKKMYTFPTNVNRYVACNDTLLHFRHLKRCMHRKQRRIPIVFAITICVQCTEGEKACSSTMTNELNGLFFLEKKKQEKKNSKKNEESI